MKLKIVAAAAIAVLLAGCATRPATKDVVANPQAHLADFTAAALNKEVAAKLPTGEPELGFKRLELDIQSTESHSDDRKDRDAITGTLRYVNAGNGLVQTYDEIRNNQLPFRINYRLTYRGLYPLKWQTVFHAAINADLAYEMKTVARLDRVPAKLAADDKLEFAGSSGNQVQVAGFLDQRRACTVVGNASAASELHASLQGQWRQIDCDFYGPSGAVSSKTTFAYLTQYGVAVPMKFTDSGLRTTHKITGVRVQ